MKREVKREVELFDIMLMREVERVSGEVKKEVKREVKRSGILMR